MTETITLKGDVTLMDTVEMSEPGNAERLALIARGRIHYVDNWNTWIVYRDGKWELDGAGVGMQSFAKMVPQLIFGIAAGMKDSSNFDADYHDLHMSWARKSNTDPQLKRMVGLARDLPGMRITSDDLDAKPHLLNLQNGTFDFNMNVFRAHDPGDMLTKMANVWYDPEAKCPQWLTYLGQWQPDRRVQRFLQQITGSGLIGVPVQNLFVNVGAGRNGKGTFYKQIQLILGEYAGTAPEDMLVESRFKVHDEEKARLRGCRLLIAPETSVGDRLDEAGIKNMTGGDMIHARHLYGRPFDFYPSHTAFLHTNYEPQIRGTDPAIWNRVVQIPWETYIKEDQRDMLIDSKLETERSGILNWLIIGCQEWLAHGLRKPEPIKVATERYRADQDHVGRFLEDSYDAMVADANQLGALDYMPSATLRKHYEAWCLLEGLRPWVAANVGKELRHKGWEPFVKKIGKTTIRAWRLVTATGQNDVNQILASEQDLSIPGLQVTPLSVFKPHWLNEEEERNGEVNIQNGETGVPAVTHHDIDPPEPTEEEMEQLHREWLYDHGYPVPPTEAEIEAYIRQMEQEYEHPYDMNLEPPQE